ncbi:hypothetical protein [Streptomyces sp. NPDC093990]|uniref:hypothetical protein n=1 Tax=Streptomyces sp. NPDC093990 TaxID=3155306 RepID=UPI003424C14B
MTDFVREGRLFKVSGFNPSHRQLFLTSEALREDVELMFLKPFYGNGLYIRQATAEEFAVLHDRHGIPTEDAAYTWMLERGGDSFVVGGHPSWREAEYELMVDRTSLYDASRPWPPDYPVESGHVSY